MEILKTYVTFVAETAQTLMDGGNLKPAQKILRGCEKCLKTTVPNHLAYSHSFLFTINNSLAQLANRLGDVKLSIKYLEAAVDSCQDPRIRDIETLPLAETYLNIANANSFLNNLKESLVFAEKANLAANQTCSRLEAVLTNSSQLG